MKKITLSLTLVLGFFGLSNAQEVNTNVVHPHENYLRSIEKEDINGKFERRNESGWYLFANDYGALNGLSYNGFVTFLFPDSCHIIYPEETGRAFTHVFGSMFDPKDYVFIPRAFSRWTDYTYDSVSWAQCYIRQVDSLYETTNISATGTVTVEDYTVLTGETFSIDGLNLVEGVEWVAEESNDSTAKLLGAAIADIQVSGNALYTVEVSGNIITITHRAGGYDGNSVTLASSNPTNLSLSGASLTGGEEQTDAVAVVDTLYIQHFTGADDALLLRSLTFQGDAQTYYAGTPNIDNYRPATLLNTSAFRTDTFLLTAEQKDSVTPTFSFISRRYSMEVDRSVSGGNVIHSNTIATSFVFKPMKSYGMNDTLISLNENINVSNKHNLLGMSYFGQSGQALRIVSEEALNNLFTTRSDLRYGATGQGGWRSYAPMLSGFSGVFYHVTSQNLSAVTPDQNGYGLGDAYPNPTDNTASFAVPFSLGASQQVTFTVTDITGRTVRTVTGDYVAGDNIVEIETTGLNAGIYFYQVIAGPLKGVGKIIVR